MTKISKFLGLLAFTALFASSCENGNLPKPEPDPDPDPSESCDVSFVSAINSRATDTKFEDGDVISITALDADGIIIAEDVKYTFSEELFSSTTPIRNINAESFSYRAVYPYMQLAEDGNVSFSVMADQSAADNYTMSDLMSSLVRPTVSSQPQLVFNHLLSQVVVNMVSADVPTAGAVATIEAMRSIDYNIIDNTFGTTGDVETITMAMDGASAFKAVVVPQSFAAGDVFCSITIDGVVYDLTFDKEQYFKAGKGYEYNVAIRDGNVTFEEVINDWEEDPYDDQPFEPEPEGFVSIGTVQLEDFIPVALMRGTGEQITVEIQESKDMPGWYRLVKPYANYIDIWAYIYQFNGSYPIISNEAQDIYINATDPSFVRFTTEDFSDDACPLGLEIAGFGELSIVSLRSGELVDGVIIFPALSLGIETTEGVDDGSGVYLVNGKSEYVITLPDVVIPDEPAELPWISGGVQAYWDGTELAEADANYSNVAETIVGLSQFEVSDNTVLFYKAIFASYEEGSIDSVSSEELASIIDEAGIEPLDAKDEQNLANLNPFNIGYDEPLAFVYIPVDGDGNLGDVVIQYITFTYDGRSDISELLAILNAPASGAQNVQVPFALKTQKIISL